ncbi:MAG: hypothetical protein KGL39_02795 [Patescibacteria group bacterium]|nr:hypothetical protein [Patescibacteria group bacterium]
MMKEYQSRLYRIWAGMKSRCFTDSDTNFKKYGARGILVCPEWNDYKAFKLWAEASGYNESLQIDRIDSNGNYSPENCRWVTAKTNQNNRRNNRRVTLFGRTQTVHQWCDEFKIKYGIVWDRIYSGWSYERAITTPKLK